MGSAVRRSLNLVLAGNAPIWPLTEPRCHWLGDLGRGIQGLAGREEGLAGGVGGGRGDDCRDWARAS